MKKSLVTTGLVFIIIVSAAGALFIRHHHSVIPSTIQKQVNFAIFYPVGSQTTIQKTSFKYDSSIKSLSFVVDFIGRQITFAEQSSPDSFADDPNFYPKLVDSLNGYATFDSINGRVDLTRPKEVQNQAGVMNAKGTLLFAKSSGDLSEDNWKLLFNSLAFIKPN